MELDKIKTYFPVDYRGKAKKGVVFYIFPETLFEKKQKEEAEKAILELRKQFEEAYTNLMLSSDEIVIGVGLEELSKKYHEEVIECLIAALNNNVTEIQKVIINDGSPVSKDTKNENEEDDEYGESDWDQALGLKELSLNYSVHAEGFEGECFNYSVYFNDDAADEEKAKAVRNAINAYDFKLEGDDYIGYLNVTADKNRVSVYLDLGNTEPQNENKIIHGILLALNSISDIKKVIINEGCI